MQYSSSFSKVNTPESKREHLAIPAPHVLLFQTDFQNKMVDPTKEHQVVD